MHPANRTSGCLKHKSIIILGDHDLYAFRSSYGEEGEGRRGEGAGAGEERRGEGEERRGGGGGMRRGEGRAQGKYSYVQVRTMVITRSLGDFPMIVKTKTTGIRRMSSERIRMAIKPRTI